MTEERRFPCVVEPADCVLVSNELIGSVGIVIIDHEAEASEAPSVYLTPKDALDFSQERA